MNSFLCQFLFSSWPLLVNPKKEGRMLSIVKNWCLSVEERMHVSEEKMLSTDKTSFLPAKWPLPPKTACLRTCKKRCLLIQEEDGESLGSKAQTSFLLGPVLILKWPFSGPSEMIRKAVVINERSWKKVDNSKLKWNKALHITGAEAKVTESAGKAGQTYLIKINSKIYLWLLSFLKINFKD